MLLYFPNSPHNYKRNFEVFLWAFSIYASTRPQAKYIVNLLS